MRGTGFPKKHQTSNFAGGRQLQPGDFAGMLPTQLKQCRFILRSAFRVCEQIRREAQQLRPLLQCLLGKSLRWGPIDTQLESAQHRFGLGRGAYAEKAEMINRQFHLF